MEERFCRTAMLLGEEGIARLQAARVAVFGLGGVGSFAAEALARAGVGHFVLVDHDRISPSNLNRQLLALMSTVGRSKATVMQERIADINPLAEVEVMEEFFLPERAGIFFSKPYDYIVDAIDTVSGKIGLVMEAVRRKIPIVSSMGAGNKLDPTRFEVADIYETSVCPLARVMRRELKARGVKALRVVYSKEVPRAPRFAASDGAGTAAGGQSPGSVSFVPSVAGLILASVVVRGIAAEEI